MIAVALALTGAVLQPAPPAVDPAPTHTLFFELKLLVRGRAWMRKVAIDQWAGGRLLVRESGAGVLELARPSEDPWTFRWYPTKDEVKLGAAIAIDAPAGDPYTSLEAALLPRARRLHETWWSDDRVTDEGNGLPSWSERSVSFWRDVHRGEESERDPLHERPTYPFHVLGETAGRLRLSRDGSGAVDGVHETMTTPWLADGWQRALRGEQVSGYGYWGRHRPWWEPRSYETLARALALMRWAPLPGDRPVRDAEWGRALGDVLATLLPKYAGRFRWRLDAAWEGAEEIDRRIVRRLPPVALAGAAGLTVRGWRSTTPAGADRPPRSDELQLLVEHDNPERFKLWLRVGYAPLAPQAPSESGNPATKPRISSRTLR